LLEGVTGLSDIDDRECHSQPHGQQLGLHGTQPRQEEETHQWRDIPTHRHGDADPFPEREK
jgi:hypothetical protein